jgi:hypothetical protein
MRNPMPVQDGLNEVYRHLSDAILTLARAAEGGAVVNLNEFLVVAKLLTEAQARLPRLKVESVYRPTPVGQER